jgi:hypothetical protein
LQTAVSPDERAGSELQSAMGPANQPIPGSLPETYTHPNTYKPKTTQKLGNVTPHDLSSTVISQNIGLFYANVCKQNKCKQPLPKNMVKTIIFISWMVSP